MTSPEEVNVRSMVVKYPVEDVTSSTEVAVRLNGKLEIVVEVELMTTIETGKVVDESGRVEV